MLHPRKILTRNIKQIKFYSRDHTMLTLMIILSGRQELFILKYS